MNNTATAREAITPAEYRAFQEAYDFLNAELFAGFLPHVLVTLQRHAKARGYFSPERFTGRLEPAAAHELALNPDNFTGRTDEEILSTLAHEMAHVWQQAHGALPRRSYHDRQWAAKMKEIGLQPSTTGEAGSKESRYLAAFDPAAGGPSRGDRISSLRGWIEFPALADRIAGISSACGGRKITRERERRDTALRLPILSPLAH